jgi:hypothetical protein
MKGKNKRIWLDSAVEYVRKEGAATGEMMLANVVNHLGLTYKEAPTPNRLAMWLRGDKRFEVVGKHRVKNWTVSLWGVKDE